MKSCRLLIALLLGIVALPLHAATFIVDRFDVDEYDLAPGDGNCHGVIYPGPPDTYCTLRAAIQEANATPGHDTIIIPSGARIVLSKAGVDEDEARTGDLDITESVTISASNPSERAVIDANNIDRVFHIKALDGIVTLIGLDIEGGNAISSTIRLGGAIRIEQAQAVSLIGCRLAYNVANAGGAIYTAAPLVISDSELHHNGIISAGFTTQGAAIKGTNFVELTIRNSSIHHNTATASLGTGAIDLEGNSSIDMSNTTVSDNMTSGIHALGSHIELSHSTIADNDGYGLWTSRGSSGGIPPQRWLKNTIIANNAQDDCIHFGAVFLPFNYYSLDSDGTCNLLAGNGYGSLPAVDPMLQPLAIRPGGKLPVRDLKPGSPAIDSGDPLMVAAGGTCLPSDQDGFPRPVNGTGTGFFAFCDIGAVEFTGAKIFKDGFE